ncbi:WD40-repeat-containing domain [Pseudocohnilembus persalinus]|uniref:WD40-repeat-containing domain n=1 Tax=Pseudocohnilembus persalinus TaxID=266149 RepID=A0A0V0R3C3_PSEPJ|nr:WD40-repeat-containing domain [Pseudocohnilembus persalinus]|eukprot:KRX08693.1 WD40-repeat-containing domain [Pseudocohnilembus persalinus]
MSYRSEVKAVKLKADRIVVILESKIFVYNFSDLRLLEHIQTCPNPLGLCSLNTEGDQSIMACPDGEVGYVNILLWGQGKKQVIKAHQSVLSCLQLNPEVLTAELFTFSVSP